MKLKIEHFLLSFKLNVLIHADLVVFLDFQSCHFQEHICTATFVSLNLDIERIMYFESSC